jgi:outer membrane protein OmpA-like peptidoglycan-associated protein
MSKLTTLLAFLVVATALTCQTGPAAPADSPAPESNVHSVHLVPVTHFDMHCSGFVTNQSVSRDHYVMAGWDAPNFVRYTTGDYVYLHGSLPEGSEYSVVRELRDADRAEFFDGQHRAVAGLGDTYAEIGRVRVVAKNGKSSAAQITFACQDFLPGDVAVPLQERPAVMTRKQAPFNRFPVTGSGVRGRIVLQKDFQTYAGSSSKVYLNIGSDKGVKPGDYFMAVRGFGKHLGDAADRASYEATIYDSTQRHPVVTDASPFEFGSGTHVHLADLPERALGELIILSVTPKSSTAMVAFSIEDIQVGDYVERHELPPPTQAELDADAAPPQVSCMAQPDTIRVGSSTLISCETSAADGEPVTLGFVADHGKLETGADHGAVLQTVGLMPGPVRVIVTATDDHDMRSTTDVTVNVEAASLAAVISGQPQPPQEPTPPPPASASKVGEVHFAAGSNVLTNDIKTQLNGIAMRLGREPQTRVVIIGQGSAQTPAGQHLAERRADNIKNYLVNDKQVDASRVETRTAGGDDKAEIWFVPPGAEMK